MATSQQKHLFEDYEGFVEKFKPKKTTDDCYTPPEIYDVIADWVTEKYGVKREDMVRPFYPGGDYERYDYPDGCCVVDNPPFSILSQIKRFYVHNNIPFFLFSPTLTCFSGRDLIDKVTHVVCDANIEYENGAKIVTSFVTNMGGDVIAESEPDLTERINAKVAELRKRKTRKLSKYEYPDHVVTAAKLRYYATHGTRFTIRRGECAYILSLDANKKGIFGGGLLLSDRAAAEKAAAEKAAAEKAAAKHWELSEREHALVAMLNKQDEKLHPELF